MSTSFIRFFLACLLLASLAAVLQAATMQTPAPPLARVVGQPGHRTVCYWVFAESAEKAQADWYLTAFPGKVTELSAPCVVTNAPDVLDANNKIVLTLQPVPGAVRYHVFKTEELPAPKVTVTATKPGNDTLYYWVQGQNGWRSSALAGPFSVKCNLQDFDNKLTITPNTPNQWKQSAWVTTTPAPPSGRKQQVVAIYTPASFQGNTVYPYVMGHSSTFVKSERMLAAWGPGAFPTTPATEKPVGTGKYLLASVDAQTLTAEDTGQELQKTQAPTVNETVEQDFMQRITSMQSSRNVHNGTRLSMNFNGESAVENDFYAGFCPFEYNLVVDRGGKNYYWGQPAAYPGYKSTFGIGHLDLTSYTESQHSTFDTNLHTYGTGDAIVQGVWGDLHGGNRDAGDEGAELMRTVINRALDEGKTTLQADAAVGAVHLQASATIVSGTGRILINLSQARSEGRIDYVDNCDIYGDGTRWSNELEGAFISFDIDNVKGKRSWFQIMRVLSPTHLKVMMYTTWRPDMNLGFSRFIYNPAKGQTLPSLQKDGLTYGGPEVPNRLYTNPMAIGVLPKEHEADAAVGKYLIAPGTFFADGWSEGGLHVEPIQQAWKKGDTLIQAPGTSQPMIGWWGLHSGELGPNDYLSGIHIWNDMNRTANGYAFSSSNFGVGLRVNLPPAKQGNGIIVLGEPVDGAYIGAPDVPLLRCYHSQIPFVQGSKQRTALEFVTPAGATPLSVRKDAVTVDGALAVSGAIQGSAQTRGEVALSGDGKRAQFTITFAKPLSAKPVVLFSTNQFARSRLVTVSQKSFTVEFETAPKAGKDNVTVWWMAQE